MGFLGFDGRTVLVTGVANRKSVAAHAARVLREEGARLVLSVRDEATRDAAAALFPDADLFVCDLDDEAAIRRLAAEVGARHPVLHGMLHSVAFANYAEGMKPFHETRKEDFLQAVGISMFSLVSLANALRPLFDPDASVVTVSISTTRMAAESYGYMAPVKAALDSSLAFLAKSFSAFSRVRFNSVNPSLLKTSASAGIPGYLDNYLYAEKAIPRKSALRTEEVADVVAFLLSPRSSGINAQGITVDAGMGINYFDREIVRAATRPES